MTTSEFTDPSPEYWREYSNLQKVKHDLIRRYLGGWFPKLGLGFWAGRVLYIDTHAGRGIHLTGNLGSPLVALRALLDHRSLPALLKRSEFRFMFIERDQQNCLALQEELNELTLPERVHITPVPGDAFAELSKLVASLKEKKKAMAPAFIFVDPYGFKIPGRLLRELFQLGRTELFVNVIWRELDMAISLARKGQVGHINTVDDFFDGPDWRDAISQDASFDQRAEQAINLLALKIGARWKTHVRMLGDNGATRYLLLHLTNHEAGRDLMKYCVWSVCPDGGYYARKDENPNQQLLITPEPDLEPVRKWLLEKLRSGPQRWSELEDAIRPQLWREVHLSEVVRALRIEGIIPADGYTGRFNLAANPRLRLNEQA